MIINLTPSQRRQVAFGLIFISLYLLPLLLLQQQQQEQQNDQELLNRLVWGIKMCLLPGICLATLIMRQALFRKSSPMNSDAALKKPTPKAILQQAQIQNTLEQIVLILIIYPIASITFLSSRLVVILFASLLFVIGRIWFVVGYKDGASGRAPGFILTVIPTLLLFAEALVMISIDVLF